MPMPPCAGVPWRRRIAGLSLAALLVGALGGCEGGGHRILHFPGASELEEVEIDNVVRPSLRLPAAGQLAFELGDLERGVLRMYVGSPSPHGPGARVEATLHVDGVSRGNGLSCSLRWEPGDDSAGWQPCEIVLPAAGSTARLVVSVFGAAAGPWFVAAPTLEVSAHTRLPPVFLFVLDTLRADEFSEGVAVVQKLAADGIVFEQARAPSSWTRPSVATLLTGLSPEVHRCETGRLPLEVDTLAEILRRHGYGTLAWSSNPNVLPAIGFGQGFDAFHDIAVAPSSRDKPDARMVLGRATEAVRALGARPYFYYVHLMDPHEPYLPDRERLLDVLYGEGRSPGLAALKRRNPSPKVLEEFQAYLGEILGLDAELSRFLDVLEDVGIYDVALLLVVSDHGEEFLDHGGVSHGKTLYEEMLRVPALLKLPGGIGAGTRVQARIDLADLLPTVLGALGIEPPAGIDGRRLLDEQGAPLPLDERASLALLNRHESELRAIVQDGWKLIVDPAGGRELFDLRADPHESVDLSAREPVRVSALEQQLNERLAQYRQGWHVRGCGLRCFGCERTLRFGVAAPASSLRPVRFDQGDDLAQGDSVAAEVKMVLSIRGHPLRPRADKDELVVSTAARPLELRAVGPPIAVVLGDGSARPLRDVLRFEIDDPGARLGEGEAPSCRALTEEPYLLVWYVEPRQPIEEALPPELLERLRALGYSR